MEIEENELHLAAGSVELTHVQFWPGMLWEFSSKCLILHVLENNPVEQVSEAARSAQPKSITVCIHFHIAHLHQQIFGQHFLHLFYYSRVNARQETEKTEGTVPSGEDSCNSSICGNKPGLNPVPNTCKKNKTKPKKPIKHQSQLHI